MNPFSSATYGSLSVGLELRTNLLILTSSFSKVSNPLNWTHFDPVLCAKCAGRNLSEKEVLAGEHHYDFAPSVIALIMLET